MRLRLWQVGIVAAGVLADVPDVPDVPDVADLGEGEDHAAMMENLKRMMGAQMGGQMGDMNLDELDLENMGDFDFGAAGMDGMPGMAGMGGMGMGMGEENLKEKLASNAKKLTYNGHGIADYGAKAYKWQDLPEAPKALLLEDFQDPEIPTGGSGWQLLNGAQYAEGKWKAKNVDIESLPEDMGLGMPEGSKHYGIAKSLSKKWRAQEDGELYASMEVKFPGFFTCGGGYFKLFDTSNLEPKGESKGESKEESEEESEKDISEFGASTPYSLMFGPDVCGPMKKIHLIIQKESGSEELGRLEFHADAGELPGRDFKGQLLQYGFALNKAKNYVQIYMDGKILKEGKMDEIFGGGFKAPEMIDDPTDIPPEDWTPPPREIEDMSVEKPADWDEDAPEMILDEDAEMPDGWLVNEPLMVPNPSATKPDDWDDAEDGEWIVPLMKNPKCSIGCGEWKPMKKNPQFKGPWVRPTIPNPDYTPTYPRRQIPHPKPYDYSKAPYNAIENFNAIGFELWTVEPGTIINNLLITTDSQEFHNHLNTVYRPRKELIQQNKAKREAAEEKMENQDRQKQIKKIAMIAVPFFCGAMILFKLVRGKKATPKPAAAAAQSATTKDKDAKEGEAKDGEPKETTKETTTADASKETVEKDDKKAEKEAEKKAEKKVSEEKETEPTETAAETKATARK